MNESSNHRSQHPIADSTNGSKAGVNRILHSRPLMFAMLFGVTGFLGLPLFWFSPVFTNVEKWVWSVIVVFYTLFLIALCLGICWWSLQGILAGPV